MKKNRTVNKKHKKEKELGRFTLLSVCLVLFSTLAVFAVSTFTKSGVDATLRNTLVAAGFGILLSYLWNVSYLQKRIDYDNALHPYRFFTVYFVCLLISLMLPQFSIMVWPVSLLFVWMTMVSDRVIGFFAGTGFIFIAMLLSSEYMPSLFLAYAATGACAVHIFSDIARTFSKSRAILGTLAAQCFSTVAFVFLFSYKPLSFEQFVLPIVGIVLTGVLLLVLMYWFSSVYLKWDTDRYMDINDPEFSLLTAIRSKDKDEYFRAVHCAFLTEKVCNALSLRTQAAKTLAYYKRIGCLDEEETVWKEVSHYFSDFEFPEDAVLLLKEYLLPADELSKESAVVLLCDELVESLTDIFKKNKDAHVSYDDMIDRLCAQSFEKDKMKKSDISVRELEAVKSVLKQEKLYYDLLR